jgi:hypothetical protein
MMGDSLGGGYATEIITLPGYEFITKTLTTTRTTVHRSKGTAGVQPEFVITTSTVPAGTTKSVVPVFVVTQAQVPLVSRGGSKIAENEMPAPEDRFILGFNGFSDVTVPNLPAPQTTSFGSLPPPTVTFRPIPEIRPVPLAPQTVVGTPSLVGGGPATATTIVPNPQSTLFREIVGFEKTILDGAASVGVRAPFFQQEGDGSLSQRDLGDITFVLKYLAYSDGMNALSIGLAVTAPTGPAIITPVGDIHSSLLQPFVGLRWGMGDVFATAFNSVLFPVDGRDTTIMFNDLGVGFVAYQGGPGSFLSWVAPITEVHVTTPLTNKHGLVYVPDLVALTEGVEIGFGPAALNLGVVIPVTGPRPFNWEGVVQLNFRY